MFESPYAIESGREKAAPGKQLQGGAMGFFASFTAGVSSAVSGKKLGGKMDDITVVVGAVVATEAGAYTRPLFGST